MGFVLLSLLFFFLCVAATANSHHHHHHLCRHEERAALWDFKQSFTILPPVTNDSSYHKIDSWKDGGDCCRSWDGVECDDITGHVIALDLGSTVFALDITGLFKLLHLQKLNLAYNVFIFSQIPSEIGLLSSLTHLNLSCSSFSGQVPSALLLLSNLTSLDLSCDYLSSDYVSSSGLKLESPNLKDLVHNLTKLEHLHLSACLAKHRFCWKLLEVAGSYGSSCKLLEAMSYKNRLCLVN